MRKIIVTFVMLVLAVTASASWARGPGGGGGGDRKGRGVGGPSQCQNPPCQQLGEPSGQSSGTPRQQRKRIRKRQRLHQPQGAQETWSAHYMLQVVRENPCLTHRDHERWSLL